MNKENEENQFCIDTETQTTLQNNFRGKTLHKYQDIFLKQSTLHWMSPHNKSIINHCNNSQYVGLTTTQKKDIAFIIPYITGWIDSFIIKKKEVCIATNKQIDYPKVQPDSHLKWSNQ